MADLFHGDGVLGVLTSVEYKRRKGKERKGKERKGPPGTVPRATLRRPGPLRA